MDWKYEHGKIKPPGLLVTVNNHKMHIYKEGNGKEILVFMSGGGTCCPTLDFKPLWTRLSSKYTVVIIEKAGYGWSETASVSRDINTLLEETRTALLQANLQPPYVLMPHSLSGIEALAWAQQYPDEVKAIVGLDAAIPAFYRELTSLKAAIMIFLYYALFIAARLGLLRFTTKNAEKSIRANGQFSEKEISIYKQMFIRNSFTKNMLDEAKLCRKNAKKVADLGQPTSTPYLAFISDGKEVGCINWRELIIDFVIKMLHGKYVTLDCGHYMHYYQSQRIALDTEKFISSL